MRQLTYLLRNHSLTRQPTGAEVIFHLELSSRRQCSSTPKIDSITLGTTYASILAGVKVAIIANLRIYEPYLPALNQFATSFIPYVFYWIWSCESLRNLWELLETVEEKTNATKSAQLTRLVKLLGEHPGVHASATITRRNRAAEPIPSTILTILNLLRRKC